MNEKYDATRCQDCDVALHICNLLKRQHDQCCDRCNHTPKEKK